MHGLGWIWMLLVWGLVILGREEITREEFEGMKRDLE